MSSNEALSARPRTDEHSIPWWRLVLDNVLLAIIYYLTAWIGHMLAIPPGNISPVWVPSGIILAAMLLRGYHVWPGIFIGAVVANAWTYADTSSLLNFIVSVLPGLANGTGDVLCTVFATWCIRRFTRPDLLFKDIRYSSTFILTGALAGPLISALFGVTSLRIAGSVEAQNFLYALITWWTGDGVGVLILTPVILVWFTERNQPLQLELTDIIILIVLVASSLFLLDYIPTHTEIRLPIFSLAPILIWSVLRHDIRLTYTGILLVTALAVIATVLGHGPLRDQALNISLINLQLFLAVLTITMMYLQASVYEQKRLVAERGLLLKEIHHRVKNNLQVISGLLILQSRGSKDDKVRMMLQESQHRINSMALIHEMLYQSEHFLEIDMQDYLVHLASSLADSILGHDNDLEIAVDAHDTRFSVETGIPLGLLITEIVTNSLKHGIRLDGNDRVYIDLWRLRENRYRLQIGDNGKGMTPMNNPVQYTTLGLKLIQSLSEQLNGNIRRDTDGPGTHYTLDFEAIVK